MNYSSLFLWTAFIPCFIVKTVLTFHLFLSVFICVYLWLITQTMELKEIWLANRGSRFKTGGRKQKTVSSERQESFSPITDITVPTPRKSRHGQVCQREVFTVISMIRNRSSWRCFGDITVISLNRYLVVYRWILQNLLISGALSDNCCGSFSWHMTLPRVCTVNLLPWCMLTRI